MRLPLSLVLLVFVNGCPSKASHQERPSGPRPCTKFAENCEISPGKLGTCVRRDDCSQGNCFVCQSQH